MTCGSESLVKPSSRALGPKASSLDNAVWVYLVVRFTFTFGIH
jgi:hypothetical protein